PVEAAAAPRGGRRPRLRSGRRGPRGSGGGGPHRRARRAGRGAAAAPGVRAQRCGSRVRPALADRGTAPDDVLRDRLLPPPAVPVDPRRPHAGRGPGAAGSPVQGASRDAARPLPGVALDRSRERGAATRPGGGDPARPGRPRDARTLSRGAAGRIRRLVERVTVRGADTSALAEISAPALHPSEELRHLGRGTTVAARSATERTV